MIEILIFMVAIFMLPISAWFYFRWAERQWNEEWKRKVDEEFERLAKMREDHFKKWQE